jgi:hypothetical protein
MKSDILNAISLNSQLAVKKKKIHNILANAYSFLK